MRFVKEIAAGVMGLAIFNVALFTLVLSERTSTIVLATVLPSAGLAWTIPQQSSAGCWVRQKALERDFREAAGRLGCMQTAFPDYVPPGARVIAPRP